MLVGYARVSTLDQNPQLQTDALLKAGCPTRVPGRNAFYRYFPPERIRELRDG